jgi:hypothetical protein
MACGDGAGSGHRLRIELEVELGDDHGQPLGTLFELRAGGHIVAAAGAQQLSGTHISNNGRVLSFFVRSDRPTTMSPVGDPFPGLHSHTRLFNWNNTLYAFVRAPMALQVRQLGADDRWHAAPEMEQLLGPQVRNLEVVHDRLLVFHDHAITYARDTLYSNTEVDHLMGVYRNGLLLVHLFSGNDDPDVFLLARWAPDVPAPFHPVALHTDPSPEPRAGKVYCMTSHGPHFLVGTNFGGLYRIDEQALEVEFLRAPDDPSWQPYCFLSMEDMVLIGHYPSGQLLTVGPEGLGAFEPPMARPFWAPERHREAQSLALYGGGLFCGVWPWGELHELDLSGMSWKPPVRLFMHPVINGTVAEHFDAPYVEEIADRYDGLYDNAWGQRITGLTLHGPHLYASTSNKGSRGLLPRDSVILSPEALVEYGTVHRIHRPGALAAQLRWRSRTALSFICEPNGITLIQDGDTLAHAPSGVEIPWQADDLRLRMGEGLFGPSGSTPALKVMSIRKVSGH